MSEMVESIVFGICAISTLGILATIAWVIYDYWQVKRDVTAEKETAK
jgi:FtsH-binding integral membrane protein